LLGQSIPAFWLGLVLVELLSVNIRLLPPAGMDSAANFVLPSITLGWFSVAAVMRILRSSMIDALDSEYVKFARSKGVPELTIVVKHCLKNALVPVLSVGGVLFATFLTGTVVVETVFAWPGVGRLTYQAISTRDFPVIQTVMMATAALVIVVNIGVDLLYGLVDPRIRQR
jgi:peptide/nickel transport system permease protein